MYGCGYDEFWYGEKEIFFAYQKKWEMEQEIIRKRENQKAWLQGLYFQYAYASCKSKDIEYPKLPLALTEQEQKTNDEIERQARKKAKQLEIINALNNLTV